ncbi:hypothetical protein SEA_SKOG_125 [Gordonia phage Skog]|uniref:Uncharacterized protein n=1 Tax=Gordonia phage Skog TaxID=2704033 RepID=A0A6G6XJN4_9CAUD|nr:hypothetical protein KHQ85_gp125 [Gordonia phage Skog]QIG58277.1 hypothetical protein SEA_SKOG_125 [Gordonia phage Skog]
MNRPRLGDEQPRKFMLVHHYESGRTTVSLSDDEDHLHHDIPWRTREISRVLYDRSAHGAWVPIMGFGVIHEPTELGEQ